SRWIKVLSLEEINQNRENGKFDGTWQSFKDENVFETEAKSRYYVTSFTKYVWSSANAAFIDGEIVVASWFNENEGIPKTLSYTKSNTFQDYGGGRGTVKVNSVSCYSSGDQTPIPVSRTFGDGVEDWGLALKCGNGPAVTDSDPETSQPAIILTRGGAEDTQGNTHIIVEEASRYPSFLYSVWNTTEATSGEGPVVINYTFHIASAVRLADAVVTGIVNGYNDGASCFCLLRAYSMGPNTGKGIDELYGELKANPFGENPEAGTVDSLQDVETIEAGMDVNVLAMISFGCLMVLSFIGISWSLLLRKKTGMDVYDRDALIRAVSLQGQGSVLDLTATNSAIRIFVRKEDNGSMSVVVSDASDGGDRSGCTRLVRRGNKVVETTDPTPVVTTVAQYNDGFGGAAVPVGPRTMWLGGMRTATSRSFPGRDGNFQYPTSVALTASPVPSDAGSFAGTPVSGRSPLWRHGEVAASPAQAGQRNRTNSFLPEGRGVSAFFDSVRSLGRSRSGSSQNERADEARGANDNSDGAGDRPFTAFGEGHETYRRGQ
ncbi:unnamed protein product, partial [Hapterophycus canaliculatus]